jgi:hypothetical protein
MIEAFSQVENFINQGIEKMNKLKHSKLFVNNTMQSDKRLNHFVFLQSKYAIQ